MNVYSIKKKVNAETKRAFLGSAVQPSWGEDTGQNSELKMSVLLGV